MANYNQSTRRDFLKASRKEGDTMWETVSNWQNISYFNNLQHEQNRYLDAVLDYQKFERKWIWGTSFLKVLQSLIFTVGLLGACYLAVYAILEGEQPIGSFVTLLLYWTQLSGPLAFFADFFRRLNTSMIDAERVLEILSLKPTVTNRKNAPKLEVQNGEVAFDNVHFDYDERKPALRGISLRAKPGTTVAFVGETGAGKSTILRLLFRFYDVKKGSIKIDGQDIRDITLESLRDAVGVVPQDPTLFNDTIMNNLRYANFKASDIDIYKACEAAAIHSQILSFPDGYNSIVGERGVKLSGGELQRIAIARAIIKNPKIILLDEATSMVDMHTERRIQKAFCELAKGRTTFVIAHRLSTVVNADQIIVVYDGKIKEIGTHDDLMKRGEAYYKLWNKQVRESFPTEGLTGKPKPALLDDLLLPEQNETPESTTTATIPGLQGSNRVSNNTTTICQIPHHRRGASVIDIPIAPQAEITMNKSKPASLPHHGYTAPSMVKQLSTLKADAPEYIPLLIDPSHPTLPPAYSASSKRSRVRINNPIAAQVSPVTVVEPSPEKKGTDDTTLEQARVYQQEEEASLKIARHEISQEAELECANKYFREACGDAKDGAIPHGGPNPDKAEESVSIEALETGKQNRTPQLSTPIDSLACTPDINTTPAEDGQLGNPAVSIKLPRFRYKHRRGFRSNGRGKGENGSSSDGNMTQDPTMRLRSISDPKPQEQTENPVSNQKQIQLPTNSTVQRQVSL
ncbi:hypothetical protein ABW20_dc0107291 [Dactylellina cionopaga]|nr:hypothetical protein ABW20_dc0107291 [Dactylellina cionopaga]